MQPLSHHRRAAECLARGEALAALNALHGDDGGHALALRGIALAQLEELDAAHRQLRLAADALADEPLYHARALAALAEVAAARRELGTSLDALADAADRLRRVGDFRNAAWARLVRARILVLIGAVNQAQDDMEAIAAGLDTEDPENEDPMLRSALALVRAAVSVRRMAPRGALEALDNALAELVRPDVDGAEGHPALAGELRAHRAALGQPLARLSVAGETELLSLPGLATVFRGVGERPAVLGSTRGWLVVDAIAARVGRCGEDLVDLSKRVVPLTLLVELARSWPRAIASDELIARVFEGPPNNDSYRERCRVEIGRLRGLLGPLAEVEARGHAWRLVVPTGQAVALVELVAAGGAITALLADGQSWAARDLALAMGTSQRSVQRTLRDLARRGAVEGIGQARSRRWVSTESPANIATQMFLVSLLEPVET